MNRKAILPGFIFGVVLALALTPVAAVSGPFEDGLDAYNSGDYATALRLWRPLAEHGDAAAQHKVGFMYHAGQGVSQDHAEAVKWYQLAAEQGYAKAQSNLGLMYGEGLGVPQDFVRTHMWLSLAAFHFPPGADRDMVVNNRDTLAKLMTPAQIAEAEKLAREWRPKRPAAD